MHRATTGPNFTTPPSVKMRLKDILARNLLDRVTGGD